MKAVIRRLIERIFHLSVAASFGLLGVLPKKKLFVFESFHGRQYSDSPKAFYRYLREKHPEAKCIWAVKKGFEQPFIEAGVPYVTRLGVRWLFTMPRAKYWIFNTRMPWWMKKGKGTIFVQNWHGTPLKRLGLDIQEVNIADTKTEQYRKEIIDESKRWDFLVSPNHFSSEIFRSAFGYDGEVLEIGYPRNDLLKEPVTDGTKQQIFNYLGLACSDEIQIGLYAPTWRDDLFYRKGHYKFDNVFPFEDVLKANPKLVILVRTHYLISDSMDFSKYQNRVINCSDYPDIADLYQVADFLITDYSSVMFDFAYTKRPMIFFMYDYDKYKEKLRGFYFDPIGVLPGSIAYNGQDLLDVVSAELARLKKNESDKDDFISEKYEKFYNEFCINLNKPASQLLYEKITYQNR